MRAHLGPVRGGGVELLRADIARVVERWQRFERLGLLGGACIGNRESGRLRVPEGGGGGEGSLQ